MKRERFRLTKKKKTSFYQRLFIVSEFNRYHDLEHIYRWPQTKIHKNYDIVVVLFVFFILRTVRFQMTTPSSRYNICRQKQWSAWDTSAVHFSMCSTHWRVIELLPALHFFFWLFFLFRLSVRSYQCFVFRQMSPIHFSLSLRLPICKWRNVILDLNRPAYFAIISDHFSSSSSSDHSYKYLEIFLFF